MNKVILMGRLTRNPEIRYSQGDNSMAIARFTLAVDRRVRRDSDVTADFIGCVAFGRTAEFFDKYTHQGSKVCVEGRIQTGSYTRQDGTKVYTTDVVVENVEFAESKAAASQQQNYGGQSGQPGYGGQQQNYQSQQGYGQQSYGGSSYQQPAAPQESGNPYQTSAPAGGSYNAQPAPNSQPYGGGRDSGFMQEAADEGFMQIPDELQDEGLPFN